MCNIDTKKRKTPKRHMRGASTSITVLYTHARQIYTRDTIHTHTHTHKHTHTHIDMETYTYVDLERAHEGIVHRHHGTRIIEFAAVVGRGKERDQLPLCEKFIPVFHHLMCAAHLIYTRHGIKWDWMTSIHIHMNTYEYIYHTRLPPLDVRGTTNIYKTATTRRKGD